jgi:hypothetical protein
MPTCTDSVDDLLWWQSRHHANANRHRPEPSTSFPSCICVSWISSRTDSSWRLSDELWGDEQWTGLPLPTISSRDVVRLELQSGVLSYTEHRLTATLRGWFWYRSEKDCAFRFIGCLPWIWMVAVHENSNPRISKTSEGLDVKQSCRVLKVNRSVANCTIHILAALRDDVCRGWVWILPVSVDTDGEVNVPQFLFHGFKGDRTQGIFYLLSPLNLTPVFGLLLFFLIMNGIDSLLWKDHWVQDLKSTIPNERFVSQFTWCKLVTLNEDPQTSPSLHFHNSIMDRRRFDTSDTTMEKSGQSHSITPSQETDSYSSLQQK